MPFLAFQWTSRHSTDSAEAAVYIHFLFYSWPFFKNTDMLKEIMPPRRGNKIKENGLQDLLCYFT